MSFFFFLNRIVFGKAQCLSLASAQRTPNRTQVNEPPRSTVFSTNTTVSGTCVLGKSESTEQNGT